MKALLKALEEGRLVELTEREKDSCLLRLSEIARKAAGFPTPIIDRVLEREAQANTYLGHGIACPHGRVPGEGPIVCAVGWSREGVDYGLGEDRKAHLVVFYHIPASADREYLEEIAGLARAIQQHRGDLLGRRLRNLEQLRQTILSWAGPGSAEAPDQAGRRHVTARELLIPELLAMVEENRLNEVRDFLSGQLPGEVADLIEVLPPDKRILIFRLLPRQTADEVFCHLETDVQNALLRSMADEETRQVLASLPPDDRTALFEELPARVTQRLLGLLDEKDRKQALTLLSYPENSVGRLMTDRYVKIRPEWTVAEALEHIRRYGTDSETLAMVYITDDRGVLKDDIPLRKIILSDPSTPVSSLLDGRFACLNSLQTREEAVQVFKRHGLFALPVVDADGVLLGIVTADDILDVAEEEATEDIQKSGAVDPLDIPYLRSSPWTIYLRRINWLVILVFVNIFSGAGIARFESLIESVVALVFFLPLLIDSGGNAGTQAATLVVRSMALGELRLSDYFKAALRETLVALLLGLSMAVAVFFVAYFRSGLEVARVVALAMVACVWVGSLAGLSLPFFFRLIRVDPAVASGPLVTSIADILGILIYFSIASRLLKVG